MSFTKTQIAEVIRALSLGIPVIGPVRVQALQMLEAFQREEARRESDEERTQSAREQAQAQAESISRMVAALQLDYDRLEELRDKRKAGAWVAGWNMPGYMPDNEPCAFETCDEARDYIADSMHEEAECEADTREATGDIAHSDNATAIDEAASMLRQSIGDRDAEYGQTIGRFHYWITHTPGELADKDEAEELAELESLAGDDEDAESARQTIYADALSVEVRSGWRSAGEELTAEQFTILLCTGGPAVRIVGELDGYGTPDRAWLEYQDWGTPWTKYRGVGVVGADLLTYSQQFFC